MTPGSSVPGRPTREELRAKDPLGDFLVWWDDITHKDADDLEQVLERTVRHPKAAERERILQRYLQEHPLLLIQPMGGGRGRWMIPQKRLGAEFIPDFVIGERHSGGFEWLLVELESPTASMFRKDGEPSAELWHALRQITDWRAWLERNRDYATRPRADAGLGLTDISPNARGLVLIGRAHDLNDADRPRRQRLAQDFQVRIQSYDWLVRQARDGADAMGESRRRR
jgi:hypothetical protein